MKTVSKKNLITSAVAATFLLLAFQPVSAFNPQPEPPAVAKPGTQNYPGNEWKPAAGKPVTKSYPGSEWKPTGKSTGKTTKATAAKTSSSKKGIKRKGTEEAGVLVEPTALEKTAPR